MPTPYSLLFNHCLRHLDPEVAHHIVYDGLAVAGRLPIIPDVIQGALAPYLGAGHPGIHALGQTFPAPFGLAAGFDKDAGAIRGLAMLGFGFIEVGTVTPRAQPGNPQPRLWRELGDHALRNQMGFNNHGAERMAINLRRLRQTAIGRAIKVGVNIGKNRATVLHDAYDDYAKCAADLAPWANYLVINVSSPNTPGLRDLQQVEQLKPIVAATLENAGRTPVLLKLAPDLSDHQIDEIVQYALTTEMAGFVAVNTTIGHDRGPGGLSGPPLLQRGLEVVSRIRAVAGEHPAIIGCGGITTADDARAYLAAGANLVQGYTGFIYEGPLWAAKVNRELLQRTTSGPPLSWLR